MAKVKGRGASRCIAGFVFECALQSRKYGIRDRRVITLKSLGVAKRVMSFLPFDP